MLGLNDEQIERGLATYDALPHRMELVGEVAGVRIAHNWMGNLAFAFDQLPHMGEQDGLHYAMCCNGSGVAMLGWLGQQSARKMLGGANRLNAFDGRPFGTQPFYNGNPWFLPIVGAWAMVATLRAGLGKRWRVGDKTGSNGEDARNDIAVLWPVQGGSPWVLTAYLQAGAISFEQRAAVLAQVGRIADGLIA